MLKRILFLVLVIGLMGTSVHAQRNKIPADYRVLLEGHLDAVASENRERMHETWLIIVSDGLLMNYIENNLPIIRSIIHIQGMIYDLDAIEMQYVELFGEGDDAISQERQNRLRARINTLRRRADVFDIQDQALAYPNQKRLPNQVDENNVNSRRTTLSPNQSATSNQQRAVAFPNQSRRTNQNIVDDRTGR